jgi:D-alanyl-D-alanine carboxypeptidase
MSKPAPLTLLFIIISLASLATVGYLIFLTTDQKQEISMLMEDRNFFLTKSIALEGELATATGTILALETELAGLTGDYSALTDDYEGERSRNEGFEGTIKELAGTVGVLDKLSKTDEELLQKYSKVSFLNEHFIPDSLSKINPENVYDESREHFLHSKVVPELEAMAEAAKADGIDLWVVSAYRSFEYQAQLKGQYLVTYGSGANAFSADQGFSEHQLGTAVDFTTAGRGGALDGFETTAAYTWLKDNAHRYGFTLSYPEDNAFYVFEPWHWRFVGTKLARDLHNDGAGFYGWEQRKINEYLISIFD